ncbi:MAG: hypothetical protein A3D67_02360 [Candidatus Lloydbacteria bacterium RIFCSPHIGHO2_02_FULL_51_22]|uniref:DNA-directed DNA polymerase n=3 Tax=Candidatus Lloydiibacteriota TaxID=1817910 RepID=A0A1G2DED3_9BACT|nr:MAG: hypothetical protein A3D67_02360 [Candidatus Lloydbacteria bacterium RIFCSPHIGHO2_02_FULL_51_22]OGZ14065.1 MAG: hypothetical protein A3J08_04030 [Candidatus Lloydbacteria bacterium RIFCSPLOWO2_02_FULL_51_11]OGZ17297.1 MAG: hypothetical protein A3G11_01855 [Candidatus Lloydbacteria bacterium RIFCSPLOWO2_12_FULL_51_9]
MPTKDKKQKKRLVLIDAHAVLHRAYHALPEFTSRTGEPTGALYGLSAMLIKLLADLAPDYVIACFDMAGPTFRHEAYEQYKAQRPKADDALVRQMNRARDVFRAFGIPVYEKAGFEADDVIGTIVHETRKEWRGGALQVTIASGDMDTLQLVSGTDVTVYTLKKGISDTIEYDEKAVVARFGFLPRLVADYKGLRGDPSDNIVGVRGIGEKTATLLIQTCGDIEAIYKKLKKNPDEFIEKGFKKRIVEILKENEEEALFSKTLATIRTDAPIAFALPKETWKKEFSLETVRTLFRELDFRTLGARAETLVRQNDETGNTPSQKGKLPLEEKEGIETAHETVLAAWVLDSNNTALTREELLEFTRKDTVAEAHEHILALLKKQGVLSVYTDIELPLVPILRAAEARGITVDTTYLKTLSVTLHSELDTRSQTIWKLAGKEFNINSPQQLGAILFETLGLTKKGIKKTAGGVLSTRESELKKLEDAHPIIPELLRYRELQKLLSTYIDTLPTLVDVASRVHTTFLQTGTTTGRLSSENPNLQNIPVKGEYGREIRRAFVAREGSVLAAFDYSQIELRVLAVLSKDVRLLDTFKKGGDIHSAVASRVFGVPESEVTKDMRRKAKAINFGIIYGMGVTSLQKSLGGTREEAQIFYDNYFAQFPEVTRFLNETKRIAAVKGYTETLFGRRRYVEGLRSSIPYIRAAAERMATNAPIQGTAADIIKIAMHTVDTMLKKEGLAETVHLLLQVHDELIYEMEKEASARAIPLIKKEMEGAIAAEIPFDVTAKTGANWGEV